MDCGRSFYKRHLFGLRFIALIFGIFFMSTSQSMALCTSPAGNAGDISYSSTQNVMAYCNGTVWVSMGTTSSINLGTMTIGAICTATTGTQISCTTTTVPVSLGGTGTSTQFTQGSVIFAGASGVYSQNNANFFWDNTNARLGIGTSSPQGVLHVNLSSSESSEIYLSTLDSQYAKIKNNGTGGSVRLETSRSLVLQANSAGAGTYFANSTNAFNAHISADGTVNSYLGALGGNLGVGTSTPSYKLQVQGGRTVTTTVAEPYTIGLGRSDASGGAFWLGISASATPDLVLSNVAGVEVMRVTNSGNVGIGISNPTYKLQLTGGRSALVTVAEPYTIGLGRSDASGGAFWLGISASATPDLVLSNVAGVEVMRVTNSGRLGVGTTAPEAKAVISNNTSASPAILSGTVTQVVGADGVGAISEIDSFGGTGQIRFRRSGGTAAAPQALALDNTIGLIGGGGYYSNGATGAWTTAAKAVMNIIAAENWTSTAQGTYFTFETTNTGTTTRTEKLRITSSGSVGIGTTAPASKLHAYGGEVQVGSSGTACSSVTANGGAIRYASGSLYYCNGTAWTAVAVGGGSSYLGTLSTATNPSREGEAGTGLYTAGAGLVDVAASGVQIAEFGSTGINIATGSLKLAGVNGLSFPADFTPNASIAIGSGALAYQTASATATQGNIAMGYQALGSSGLTTAAARNTAVGYQALANNTSSYSNTAFGYRALYLNTNSGGNTAIGNQALYTNRGPSNTAVGSVALYQNNGGQENTGVGNGALYYNVSGHNNTAVGRNALAYSTGTGSGTAIGHMAGYHISTGTNNSVFGYGVASTTLATGSSNILIGTSNAVDTPAADTSNFLNIGNVLFGTGMTGTVAAPAGYVGIGTAAPVSSLHVASGGLFSVTGTAGAGDALPVGLTGAGTRMFFYPRKAAFRVGIVDDAQWDDANIGDYSAAMGSSSTASGSSSTAMGEYTIASGYNSTAMGSSSTASGSYSTAMGSSSTAGGNYSTAMGIWTVSSGNNSTAMGSSSTASGWTSLATGFSSIASGDSSTAMGQYTTAAAYIDTAIGQYNVGGGTADSWVATDPLFEIGIGTADAYRANAVTVLKNGRVGIGSTIPVFVLDVHRAGTDVGGLILASGITYGYRSYNAVEHSNGANYSGTISAISYSGDTYAPFHAGVAGNPTSPLSFSLIGQAMRNSAWNSSGPTALQSGDYLPGIGFAGQSNTTAGTGMVMGASINAIVNGTVSSGVLPTDIVFRTSLTNAAGLSEKMRIMSSGQVGVGTAAPASLLHVYGGEVQVGSSGAACSAANGGAIRYDSASVYYCNGTAWTAMSGGGGSSYLGTSVTATNPSINGDATTGLYTAGAGLVDVAASGVQIAEFGSTGINIATGSLRLAGVNGLSFPADYTTNASIAIGSGALAYQTTNATTTQANVAVGYQALGSSGLTTNAKQNTAIGYQALLRNTSGYDNTAVGYRALDSNTTGINNSAYGLRALDGNTTGHSNTAIGYASLLNNASGDENTSVGSYSMYSNSTGLYNAALGAGALQYASTGWYNVAVGEGALRSVSGSNLTGNYNTAVGNHALYGIQTTAASNTAIGYNTGATLTTGTGNILIGANADVASATAANTMNIGNVLFGTGMTGTVAAPAGYVGIGTVAPAAALDIYSSVTPTVWNQVTGLKVTGQNNGMGEVFEVNAGAGQQALIVSSSGTTMMTGTTTVRGYSGNQFIILNPMITTGPTSDVLFNSYDDSYSNANIAKISASKEVATAGAVDAYLAFSVTNNSVSTEAARFISSGYLGIGTAAPASKLHVYGGEVQVGSSGTACSATNGGAIRYDAGAMYYCDGASAWTAMSGGGGSSYLGTALTATNPSINGDATTGLYTAGAGLVDVAASGVQIAEFGSTGINIATGSLRLAGVNGLSFPYDYETNASIAIGSGALAYQPGGTVVRANVAIGYQALGSSGLTSAGKNNTAVGYKSLSLNTSGASNSAVGGSALYSNTAGSSNSAVGLNALYSNSIGNSNSAFGTSALYANVTGNYNTAVGSSALRYNLTGSYNSAFGYNALLNNTGGENSAFGYRALSGNTSGTYGSAFGYLALHSNTASYNSAFGHSALYSNTTGTGNTAVGQATLYSNTTGGYNSAFGNSALRYNTGGRNTAFGASSLYGVEGVSTGGYNTAIGSQAGYDVTTGANNIFLGNFATTGVGVTTGNNNIMIGYDVRPASVTASNQLNIGNLIYATSLASGATLSTGYVGIGTPAPVSSLHVASGGLFSVTGTYGSGDTLPAGLTGEGTRMFFYPRKAAFRAGYVDGTQWDDANIGEYSFAFGYGGVASGEGSVALGVENTANQFYSSAIGYGNTSSGNSAVAMGFSNTASQFYSLALGLQNISGGNSSVALGANNTASGNYSVAIGSDNSSTGTNSVAIGANNVVSNFYSVGMGLQNSVSGNAGAAFGAYNTVSNFYGVAFGLQNTSSGNSSFAAGSNNTASGNYSSAVGVYNIAQAYLDFAIGQYSVGGGTADSWVTTDPLFEIGVGTADAYRANAVTVLKSGNVGIGTATPSNMLEVVSATPTNIKLIANAGAGGTAGLILDSTTRSWQLGPKGSTENGKFIIYDVTTPARRMAISADGNIRIGSSATDANARLMVQGTTTDNTAAALNVVNSGDVSLTYIRNDGVVGIATTAPASKLHVYGGEVQVGSSGAACSAANGGAIRYDSASVYYCNGTAWTAMSGGGGSSYLGTAVTATSPSINGDATTGLYTAGAGLVDVAASGVQIAEFGSTGINIATGSLRLAGVNGLSFPADYTANASIAIGSGALAYQTASTTVAQANIAIGYQAMGSSSITTTTVSNVAVGYRALYYNRSFSNTAVGHQSLASNTTGGGNTAFGVNAIGANTTGQYNTGLGVAALYSSTTGSNNVAVGNSALRSNYGATGNNNTAIGANSLYSMNSSTTANNNTAVGYQSGYDLTTGANNIFLGNFSTTGVGVTTGNNNIMIGYDVRPASVTASNQLNIGNLIYATSLSSGATVSAGYVGIGTAAPVSSLHVASGGLFAVTGTYGSGDALPAGLTGAGTRMFFYPQKAAFRAGDVSGTQWDDANIGNYSVAMGSGTTASGLSSTAMGYYTTASGASSTAMGYSTTANGLSSTTMGYYTTASGDSSTAMGGGSTASGSYSTAMGGSTTASGTSSTAMGMGSIASGNTSTAMGQYTTAAAYIDTAIGQYNVGGGTADSWVATDPIFEIGIGTADTARVNAVTVLKSGNVGIGSTIPVPKLDIVSNISPAVWNQVVGAKITTSGSSSSGFAFQVATAGSANSLIVHNNGKVMIGAGSSSDSKLSIQSDGGSHVTLYNSLTTTGDKIVQYYNSRDVAWGIVSLGRVNAGMETNAAGAVNSYLNFSVAKNSALFEAIRINSDGNIGVGTATPASRMHVYGGEVQVGSSGTACSATNGGAIRYDAGAVYYCDGSSAWANMADGGASYLGASATAANPSISGDATTGLYTAGAGLVDVAAGGVKIAEFGATGINIATGSLKLAGINGLSFPPDFLPNASIAIGSSALAYQTVNASSNQGNIALGYQVLGSSGLTTAARYNVGIGTMTLQYNTSGNHNTAVGVNTLGRNTSGYNNTAIGAWAMSNLNNGQYVTGSHNTAVGYLALSSHTSAAGNVAVGSRTMYANTLGSYNAALGSYALYLNVSGDYNVAVGEGALRGVSGQAMTGDYNTAMGPSALQNLQTTSTQNTAIGYQAGNSLTVGNYNILVGANADVSSATVSNFMNIGNVIFGTGLNGTVSAPAGNVGIGTAAPAATLDVNGAARLAPQTAAPLTCSSTTRGSISYASTANRLCICDGTNWIFNHDGSACTW